MNKHWTWKRIMDVRLPLCAVLSMAPAAVVAAPLSISPTPLFLVNTVKPNIMYTLDNSGSMDWAYMPDGVVANPQGVVNTPPNGAVNTSAGTLYDCYKNSVYNDVYYDPNTVYKPGVDAAGNPMANESFTAAQIDPYYASDGGVNITVNLSAAFALYGSESPYYYYDDYGYGLYGRKATYFFWWGYTLGNEPAPSAQQPAFYYNYTGSGTPQPNVCYPDSSYTKVVVSSTSGPGGTDERQNFANWFSYYRTRILMTKSALGTAFSTLNSQYRVGFSTIDDNSGGPNQTGDNFLNINDFTTSQKTSWYNILYSINPGGGTPLQQALVNDGEYFRSGVMLGASSSVDPVQYSCQQNFTVLSTDGFWNANYQGVGDQDEKVPTLPATVPGLTPGQQWPAPFYEGPKDTYDTLADVAMYYWVTDLRTSGATAPNNVPTSSQDPASWQHMTTFTIGLGAPGTLNYPGDTAALNAGTKTWPVPIPNDLTTIDDLWHAGVNGRGGYLSAKNPNSLTQGLQNILGSITNMTASASAVALNSGSYTTNSHLYQGAFNSADWSGQLISYPILANGTIGSPDWNAGTLINTQNFDTGRTIISFNPATAAGIPFRWTNLDPTSEQGPLNHDANGILDNYGSARLNYVRGDPTNEGKGLDFRSRPTSKLGDIVDSAPLYVGPPNMNYPDNIEPVPYSSFVQAHGTREPMIFVGANDGMLHGFDATSGQTGISGTERIAYVPTPTYTNLSQLTSLTYSHHWYVDGSPTAGDVFYGNAWHTVLVSGLDGGGQGLFALDVTDPTAFSEANAASLALWEFTDANDADLGDTYSRPAIVLLNNGVWAAIVGNGYNNTQSDAHVSTTGHAVLYILNIQTGAVIAKFDTGAGTTTSPDGLSTPAVVDVNGDNTADYVYAGDLQGNLWKFDISSTNPAQWGVAYSYKGKPAPLYSAVDSAGTPQPITTAPQVGPGPLVGQNTQGYLVYFGTGSYFQNGDNTNTNTQTFYGIWDNGATVPNRVVNPSALVQQTVLGTATTGGSTYRVISSNPVVYSPPSPPLGWYIDLPTLGERSVTDPLLRNGRVIFTTTIPNTASCSFGGSSWLMELDAMTGGQLSSPPFDVNGDGAINSGDTVILNGKPVPPGGVLMTGIVSAPAVQTSANGKGPERKYFNTSSGSVATKTEAGGGLSGRVSWQQIQ